jgi:hypothetical protein
MVYVGLFFVGVTSAALAAMYVPKKKTRWEPVRAPRVKVKIKLNGE